MKKVYKCPWCKKAFRFRMHWEAHLKTHEFRERG